MAKLIGDIVTVPPRSAAEHVHLYRIRETMSYSMPQLFIVLYKRVQKCQIPKFKNLEISSYICVTGQS